MADRSPLSSRRVVRGRGARVVVVTVSYNSSHALKDFLASIPAALDGTDAEVVIVDNASADVESTRRLAVDAEAHLLRMSANLGYGSGIDAGAREYAARSEYILIVNPDVEFRPGSIAQLVRAADAHPEAGAVGPRILEPDGSVYPSARNLPSLRHGVGHAVFAHVWPSNPWTRGYRAAAEYGDEERESGWLSGACLLVRRSAWEAVRGFDRGYFMYFEDVDLGARLGRAGWKNIYAPQAVVLHTGAHSTAQTAGSMDRVHHQSAYRYISRTYSAWWLAPLRLIIRVALIARVWWRGRQHHV